VVPWPWEHNCKSDQNTYWAPDHPSLGGTRIVIATPSADPPYHRRHSRGGSHTDRQPGGRSTRCSPGVAFGSFGRAMRRRGRRQLIFGRLTMAFHSSHLHAPLRCHRPSRRSVRASRSWSSRLIVPEPVKYQVSIWCSVSKLALLGQMFCLALPAPTFTVDPRQPALPFQDDPSLPAAARLRI
jgi:hypothetical protein